MLSTVLQLLLADGGEPFSDYVLHIPHNWGYVPCHAQHA